MGLLGAVKRFMLSSAERLPLVPFVGALATAEGAMFAVGLECISACFGARKAKKANC